MLILADIVLLYECKPIDRYEQNTLNVIAHLANHRREDPINQSELAGEVRQTHEQMSVTIGHF